MAWTRAVWLEYSKEGVVSEFENTIPSNWIKSGFVYWPNRKVESAVQKRYDPTDDWLKFKLKYVKITDNDRGVCDEYGDNVTAGETAGVMDIIKCKQISPNKKRTVLPLPVPPTKKKRTTKSSLDVTQFLDDQDENSEEEMFLKKKKRINIKSKCLPLNSLPGSSQISMPKNSQRMDSMIAPENVCLMSSVIPSILPIRKDSASIRDELFLNNNDNKAFQLMVIRKLEHIDTRLDDLFRLVSTFNESKDDVYHLPQPFAELADLITFDAGLTNLKEFKAFVKELSRLGGSSAKKCVANVLNRLMANKLQAKFNLTGSNTKQTKKIGFQTLNIYRDAVTRSFKIKKHDARTYIADCLKFAPYRLDGGKRASNQNETEVYKDADAYICDEENDDILSRSF
ncbi:uncharacterized protein LOC124812035 isoform X2 [Hydra vulgaris]|uniref:uncharacterized protein LOC124807316 isoform X2 n=1 Tax=Hydra vulgaris TaxID=6087 RepID=UPI001F5FA6B9|nr:uncharacterized protein LOC124807316 isoform X2 [Hydra vulgaris]XP_047133931.1 uncharacterized protein LOC124812035 isoform X2 [Hydra vulgaris]